MVKNYSVEQIFKIWDDNSGDFYEISEDPDGLGLCCISHSCSGERVELPAMDEEQARLLVSALQDWCDYRSRKDQYKIIVSDVQ